MKKAIEMNAKEDDSLSTALEKLDKEKQAALFQLCDKKRKFIREKVTSRISFGLRQNITDERQKNALRNNSFNVGREVVLTAKFPSSSRVTCSYRQREKRTWQAATVGDNSSASEVIKEKQATNSSKTTRQNSRKPGTTKYNNG